jgi:hypothetical protein
MDKKYTIGIYVFYFGKWPGWILLYFETLKKNPSIDFHFFTDCDDSIVKADNIFFHKYTFEDYKNLVRQKLDVELKASSGIKLCDLRPFIGYLHEDVFKNYDFYGWTDSDILFGDIRSFYTNDILEKYEVFSTHGIRISGHLSLFRNTKRNRFMFRKIYKWKEALENPSFVGIDEHGITNAYTMTIFDRINEKFKWGIRNGITRYFSTFRKKKLYFKEQYTTPFTIIPWIDGSINSYQPDIWFYKNGKITNNRDGDRNFIYLHFMNFKSSEWRHDGTKAPWEGMENICKATVGDMEGGLIIDKNGILPMKNAML